MMERIRAGLKGVWNAVLSLLYPGDVSCLCCAAALDEREEDGVCPICWEALEALEAVQAQYEREHDTVLPGLEDVCAAYPYRGQARELIHRLKYDGLRGAAVPLAKAMALLPLGEADVLVPVPTSKRRIRRRGYNQSELLCRELSAIWGMPMRCALERTKERPSQTKLSGEARLKNLVGCMQAGEDVKGLRILLIDDVLTTGATACEAARALYTAGAQSVSVCVCASTAANEPHKKDVLPF